jgi:ABC-type transport system involved in cytochrome c biogenesis permease subunit
MAAYGLGWAGLLLALSKALLRNAPIAAVLLLFLAALDAGVVLLVLRRARVQELLPEPENVERWCYQAALYALPLLTVYGVSGAAWSYDAFGSFWSWPEQQLGWFVAWLGLALALHLDRSQLWASALTWGGWLLALGGAGAGARIVAGSHAFWPFLR